MPEKEIIDIHVHFGAPGPSEECFWSEKFTNTFAYFAMRAVTKTLFKEVSYKRVKNHLFKALNRAKKINKMVLLALDKVYTQSGDPRDDLTHLFASNSCILKLSEEFNAKYGRDRLLVGASVHPFNPDWEAELDFCVTNGAVLCKWIPSSQMIDLEHEKCLPFYEKLAEYKLPLLCHSGPEHAIPTSDDSFKEFDNPKYLKPALERNVTVILAHCSLPVLKLIDGMEAYNEMMALFAEAETQNWQLYADLSALSLVTRHDLIKPYVIDTIKHSQLIYGSDYPIPISDLAYNSGLDLITKIKILLKALKITNPLDKNLFLTEQMGFEKDVFDKACELFSEINRNG